MNKSKQLPARTLKWNVRCAKHTNNLGMVYGSAFQPARRHALMRIGKNCSADDKHSANKNCMSFDPSIFLCVHNSIFSIFKTK